MADFDQFESAPVDSVVEEDPAAAFLAREQDDLAALEGDEPTADVGGDNDFGMQDATDQPATAADAGMFDPLGGGEDANDNLDFNAQEQNDFDASNAQSSDPYNAIKSVDVQRQEPEQIRIWREKQMEMLEKKDADSEDKKGEMRQVAKKELEDWYKHCAEQLEKTKKTNLEGEEAFIQERDESLPGHEWERICRLCDFNPKFSRTSKDISRMRSILLQLKQTGIQRS